MPNTNHTPNIVIILTDQQTASMMSCAGNPYLHTPALDRLAARGTRFERAYCTNPLCVPARFSLMTGRMPSAIGLRGNVARDIPPIPESVQQAGLGWLLRAAGYDVVYAGKEHFPKMRAPDLGFDVLTRDERGGLAELAADYIQQSHPTPYLLVASFINPHDICYMALRAFGTDDFDKLLLSKGETELATLDAALQLPEDMTREVFFAEVCPPLPPNFEPQQDEPQAVQDMLAQRTFRHEARAQWSEEMWRLHRWAYARLTERVDYLIGKVLDAVDASGQAENTVVIFTSDHGDMDAAHRMEHKTALYEEACHIPFIVSPAGTTARGRVDVHLVSNGLDLVPTVCDYAGLTPPDDLQGLSVRALAEGRAVPTWREYVPIESAIGRAIVTERYKYVLYDTGAHREQLMDLQDNPPEMRNAARDAGAREILAWLRDMYRFSVL